jgi:hypothetical protein
MAKVDVDFYHKIREHLKKEPEENLINTKARHEYYTQSDESEEGTDGDNEGGDSGVDTIILDSEIIEDASHMLNESPGLGISDKDLDKMMKK